MIRRALAALALVALLAAGLVVGALAAGESVFSFTFTDSDRVATVPQRVHTVTVSGKKRTVTDPARTYTFPGQTHSVTTTVAGTTSTPVTTTAPSGEPAPIAGQGYHEAFRDDFDTLNASVWDNHIWYDDPPNPAWTGFQSAESGVLHLRTSRNFIWSGTSCSGDQPDRCNWPINTVTTHSSGRTFQYGYFEARMNWTGAPGSWPAFWLLSKGWADTGSCTTPAAELDVMEGQGTEPDVLYGTVHQDASGSGCKADLQNGNNWQPMGFRLADGWHTYSALWEPGLVSWYVDGQFVMSALPYADFNQPMFLLLQEWVGGWTSDPTSASPNVMENQIDYVSVWQK